MLRVATATQDRLEEAGSSKKASRTTLLTPSHPTARIHNEVLADIYTAEERPSVNMQTDPPPKIHYNIKWTLLWLNFCKYQLLDQLLDTSTQQKQKIGLRNRALKSTPQPAVKCGSHLCVRLSFSYQTILFCIQMPSRALWWGRSCTRATSQAFPQQGKSRQMLWT